MSCAAKCIAQEAVTRHAIGPLAGHLAIRSIAKDSRVVDFTYRDLNAATNRFANVLKALGIGKSDGVFALAGRIPEPYIAALLTIA
jgi:acetyl-CoA synthetase